MEIVRKEYSYPSVTGEADIFARSWAPADGKIKDFDAAPWGWQEG